VARSSRAVLMAAMCQGDWYRWFWWREPSMISRCLDIVLHVCLGTRIGFSVRDDRLALRPLVARRWVAANCCTSPGPSA